MIAGYTDTERIFQFFQISVDEGWASPTITIRLRLRYAFGYDTFHYDNFNYNDERDKENQKFQRV